MAASEETDGRDHFLAALAKSHRVAQCCHAVFHHYGALLAQIRRQRKEIETLAALNSTLTHDNKRLEADVASQRSAGATGEAANTRLKELEQEKIRLEEELRSNYKIIREHDTEFIKLHKDAMDLRGKVEHRDKEVARLQAEVARLTDSQKATEALAKGLAEQVQALQRLLKDSEEGRGLLVKEVQGWKAMADQSSVGQLQAENNSLVQRLMDQKIKEMETVNEMTELNRAHERKIQQLEMELRDLRSGATDRIVQGLRSIATTESVGVDRPPAEATMKLDAHTGECNMAAFNPLGTLIATGGVDKRIKVWDAKTFELVHSFSGPNASVVRVCFSAAGDRLLAGCNDNACYVMVVGQNRMFCTLTGHTEKVWGCGFGLDSKVVVTAAHDRTIRWWDLQSNGRCMKTVLCGSSCNDLVVHPGSDLVCTAHLDSQLKFWDSRSYKVVHAIEDAFEGHAQVTSVCLTPDSSGVLASGRDGVLKVFDLRTYEAIQTFGAKDMVASINHYKACMSPDGKYIAAGSSSRLHAGNQTLCVWDLKGRLVARLKEGHAGPITCCAWHPDGAFLLSTGHDGKLIVWK
eukprot:GGOE01019329.1.p1 GENE.GGOE01019329.1~~GGOE01019329.1.p1  ORF type:complete len:585 (+),score=209.83 GGOE01019329.1:26-1756(+)